MELGGAFDDLWDENYEEEIPKAQQDELIKNMLGLTVSLKQGECEQKKSLQSPVDGEIWEYVKLLSSKLDDDCIRNLHRNSANPPVVNLMANMLSNHKLRTSFDFETALDRLMNKSSSACASKGNLKWNFNLLNMIGGTGTAASVVFELKENGNFRGLKRKKQIFLRSPRSNKVLRKAGKEEKSLLSGTRSPKFKLVEDINVGNVLKIKSIAEQDTPCHQVKLVSKQVKVGRSLASKTSLRNSCTKSSSPENKSSSNVITCKDDCEGHKMKRQVAKSIKERVNEGKQLKIGGFLVNKQYLNEAEGSKTAKYDVPQRTPNTSRRKLKNVCSPYDGQGSIQKFLKGRVESKQAGAELPLDGTGVGSRARLKFEKACTQADHQAEQGNQLTTDSSAHDLVGAASQKTEEVDSINEF